MLPLGVPLPFLGWVNSPKAHTPAFFSRGAGAPAGACVLPAVALVFPVLLAPPGGGRCWGVPQTSVCCPCTVSVLLFCPAVRLVFSNARVEISVPRVLLGLGLSGTLCPEPSEYALNAFFSGLPNGRWFNLADWVPGMPKGCNRQFLPMETNL